MPELAVLVDGSACAEQQGQVVARKTSRMNTGSSEGLEVIGNQTTRDLPSYSENRMQNKLTFTLWGQRGQCPNRQRTGLN
jgi:hypothetical protein